MALLGMPMAVVIWLLIAVAMTILLPLYFGMRFTWDPSSVERSTKEYERENEERA